MASIRHDHKVFGIGLGRTGTSTLARAMAILDYNSKHAPKFLYEVDQYDFLNDVFIAWRYEFLDHMFPNAKFILTYREREDWLSSTDRYSRKKSGRGPLRRLEGRFYTYGATEYDRQTFSKAHDEFHRKVFEYFKDRDDFLVLRICEGEGWDKLCPFLGKPVPDVPFPHRNKGVKDERVPSEHTTA